MVLFDKYICYVLFVKIMFTLYLCEADLSEIPEYLCLVDSQMEGGVHTEAITLFSPAAVWWWHGQPPLAGVGDAAGPDPAWGLRAECQAQLQ